ncbi:hypothetical protein [Vibrio splendidus]|uniref:hypothetical protein n=1 Tax=Vibrio splendidus TaxID=29497 RepID=UPI000769E1A4|nr:hypothetical protein [Vibrio splendidus]
MIDSKYIKHPYYCENCNSMTPYLAMSSSVEEQKEQAESEARQWKIGMLVEYIVNLLFKDDKDTPGFFIDQEYQYQCEKCGTKSWH